MNTTDQFVIAQLAEANPVPETVTPDAQERARAERLLRRVLQDAPPPRRHRARSGILASAMSVLVVVVVVAVVLRTGGSSTTGSPGSGRVQITLRAQGTPQTPQITPAAMSREVALVRHRLASLGHGYAATQSGPDAIVVTGPQRAEPGRIADLITQPARLRVYDWEANVLTPTNGKPVAGQLSAQNATAIKVSQGGGFGPGFPGAGSSSLYDAVTLATKQPPVRASRSLSRLGAEYYLFGAPGSAACAVAAAAAGAARPSHVSHCLLAGPLEPGSSIGRQRAIAELAAQVPAGVNPSTGRVLVVPQGTLVVQAEQPHAGAPVSSFSPAAQFFVMRDHVALTGKDITDPTVSTDTAGAPDVTFRFTRTGRAAFQRATRVVAHRGASVSPGGILFNQHFAVAVDNQLVTIPSISFRQYPDGIVGASGADISGDLTARTARDLATQLRYGPLPLALRVVR
jgi:SecD/SecF fusion protein